MKKFVFTLQKLYDVKSSAESEERNRLAGLIKERDAIEQGLRENKKTYETQMEHYSDDCRRGMSGIKLKGYGAYFDYLIADKKRMEGLKIQCEKRVSDCQKRLMKLMNEKRVLDRMREEQLLEYKKEVQKDEEKALEDFMSSGM